MLIKQWELLSNRWFVFFSLAAAVLICYAPAFNNGFTNWDDQEYVLNNKSIQSLSIQSIVYLFSHFLIISYHPLTLFSFQLNYFISGTSAFGYILTNIIFHILNCYMLYILLREMELNKNIVYYVSLLFAIHPLFVESVAWIAERKDVLYTFFFLLSLYYYTRYFKTNNKRLYFISILFFLFSCLSKAQAITLSLVLFLIDYFLTGRLEFKKALNKIPFLMISILFGLLNVIAQGANAKAFNGLDFTFLERMAFAAHSYLLYIIRPLLPLKLSAFYPYPAAFKIMYYIFIPAAIILFLFTLYYFRKNKLVIFSSFFFTINIFFLLQLFPVGDAMMADHYSYLPSIGLFILIVYWFEYLINKFKAVRIPVQIIAVIYFLFLVQSTFARCGIWKNGITLWSDVIKKYPNTSIAYVNRGSNYYDKGNTSAALSDFENAIRLDSMNSFALFNAATIYFSKGDFENCLRVLQGIDSGNPVDADAFLLKAYSENKLNDYSSSLRDVEIYLAKNKTAEGFTLAGLNEIMTGDYVNAKTDLDRAIEMDSTFTDAFVKKGVLLFQLGDTISACNAWRRAGSLGSVEVSPFIKSYCR